MPIIPASTFREIIPGEKRLLCLDVGSKTVGMAMSDTSRMIASPHQTLQRIKFSKDAILIKRTVNEFNIGGLVIGYPINMDGSEGPRCQSIRQFAVNLEEHIDLPMLLWDERLSTLAVERVMLEADLSRAKRQTHVDKLAATYILQGYLDSLSDAC